MIVALALLLFTTVAIPAKQVNAASKDGFYSASHNYGKDRYKSGQVGMILLKKNTIVVKGTF